MQAGRRARPIQTVGSYSREDADRSDVGTSGVAAGGCRERIAGNPMRHSESRRRVHSESRRRVRRLYAAVRTASGVYTRLCVPPERSQPVPIGIIMEFEGFAPENYEAVRERIDWPANRPEGISLHVAGPTGSSGSPTWITACVPAGRRERAAERRVVSRRPARRRRRGPRARCSSERRTSPVTGGSTEVASRKGQLKTAPQAQVGITLRPPR
jgi:hypothetical protein